MRNLIFKASIAAILFPLLLLPAGAHSQQGKNEKKKQQLTAEQIAELVILAHGGLGGRNTLQFVKKNGVERGTIRLAGDRGETVGNITIQFMRKEKSWLDHKRIDVELPNRTLTLGFDGVSVWGALNGKSIVPRPEDEKLFRARLIHTYDSLLRYKEDESKLEYIGSEKIVGIDTEVLDLIHNDGSKTRYYISGRTFRILHLEYDLALSSIDPPVKFRESFLDFRTFHNILIPGKITTIQDGKFVQEVKITSATYSGKMDERIFQSY